jgi:tetratricopeptide (TPR) repeat protein
MWIVLFVAIWLSITRGDDEDGRLAGTWLMGIAGAIALHWAWFVLVPRWSLELAGGDRDRQSRLLRWVINTPIPGGPQVRARYLLAANEQEAGRYAEAEAGFRSLLDDYRDGMSLPPGFESLLVSHLADTLEASGRRDEAIAERDRAVMARKPDQETSVGFQIQGQWLDRDRRYAEAVAAYERALASCPPEQRATRVGLMMHLALSSFNAGCPADMLRWADAVISIDPGGPREHQARRLAAIACSNLGRLQDAERHARSAWDRAQTPKQCAEAMALLGEYVMRSGDLDGAERIALEAEAILPGGSRTPWIVLSLIQRERSRFQPAIEALERARTIPIGPIPAGNRRADAMIDLLLALDHADLGHHDVARELIGRAEEELAGDEKLTALLDATAALTYALAGEREEAVARIGSVDKGRHAFPEDRGTQDSVLSRLGWATLEVGRPERAEAFLREFLDRRPDPLYLPYAWYLLGGCRRRLGDESGGRECDVKAASTRTGCRWERYARERLAAEGVSV